MAVSKEIQQTIYHVFAKDNRSDEDAVYLIDMLLAWRQHNSDEINEKIKTFCGVDARQMGGESTYDLEVTRGALLESFPDAARYSSN